MEQTDILIAGGGIAGLTAAARLAGLGRSVTLVDPAPRGGAEVDLRTTALLQPSIRTLQAVGAWEGMKADAAPLRVMRLVDAGGRERKPRETADFEATQVPGRNDAPFGQNVANTAIRAALEARIEALGVTWIAGTAVTGSTARMAERIVRLSDGRQIAARLVIAADGRDSTLRTEEGLATRRWHYGQKALVFAVHHPNPHDGVSTEIHRTGGPLTLVPMPDRGGRPASSVVWMVPGAQAAELAEMDDATLATELTAETMGLYGPLEITGPRAVWPIIGQVALTLTAPRMALVAEAAHVIPPIGAQGLNMSLKDLETLAGLIGAEARTDPGDARLLSRYQQRRLPDIMARVAGVDLLNRFAQAEPQPLRDLRLLGLRAINGVAPVRQLAMRLGLGV